MLYKIIKRRPPTCQMPSLSNRNEIPEIRTWKIPTILIHNFKKYRASGLLLFGNIQLSNVLRAKKRTHMWLSEGKKITRSTLNINYNSSVENANITAELKLLWLISSLRTNL